MHELLLANAVLPTPASVLELPLRPYSLGHELFLLKNQSPLAKGELKAPCRPADLVEAVWICSNPFSVNAGGERLARLKRWAWRRRIDRAQLRGGANYYELQVAAFVEYRQAGTLELPISDTLKPGDTQPPRPQGTPFLLRLHQFVMSHLGCSEAGAWDYPYGLAKVRWQSYLEGEGALDIYNEADADFDRFVAEQEAKALAESPIAEATAGGEHA